jgi:hypothetical protein
MTKIVVRIEGHYEVREAPFSRSYDWHPALVTLECDCGEKLTLTTASPTPTCRCGVDHTAIIRDVQEREGRLHRHVAHPWRYDSKEQAQQHLRNEAAHPEESPWRYNDVTSVNTNNA